MSSFAARYFDGKTGLRLDLTAELDVPAGMLRLVHPELPGGALNWPLGQLRAIPGSARTDEMTVALVTDASDDSALVDVPRVVIKDAAAFMPLRAAAPDMDKRDLARGTIWKVISRASLAVAAVAVMLFVILPSMADTLARFIPPEREARWGKAVVSQMERVFGSERGGNIYCTGAEGRAALDKMLARLTETTPLAYELNVSVFNHGMVNAFAAPGGQVVLMRGLLEKADTPEEVAAVLAHEIAHVENRDATRNTLRAAGSAGLLAMVLGDFAGGSLAVVMAEMTMNASYTREAEAAADAYAHQMLDAAGITVAGMRMFFDRLAEGEGRQWLPEYLASHPDTRGRADAARDFADGQGQTSPVLSAEEWAALKGMCR